MYGSIRRYRVRSGPVSKIIDTVKKGLLPLLEKTPGFVAYYVINGEKIFATSGDKALTEYEKLGRGFIVVWATIDPSAGRAGMRPFVVEAKTPGCEVTNMEHKLGIRASATCECTYENYRIPLLHRIGNDGDGFKIAMSILDAGRIGIAAQALGIAEAAYEASVAYAKERSAFGSRIAEFQAIQFMLADMAVRIEAADRAGFLLHVELPVWSDRVGKDGLLNSFMHAEGHRILKTYGNHPSFLLMLYGNEPGGKAANAYLAKYVQHYKALDHRRSRKRRPPRQHPCRRHRPQALQFQSRRRKPQQFQSARLSSKRHSIARS